jgi:GNAT superfamily N-acetyltransferase
MAITIQKVDGSDQKTIAILRYLQKECLPADVMLSASQGYWWIAYTDKNIPVGFAGLTRSNSWFDCGYLCRAGVIWEYQGKGIQKRLIRVREAQARKLKWNWLISDTYQNPASANSLISCGFKLFEPTSPWAFKTSLYWRKRLVCRTKTKKYVRQNTNNMQKNTTRKTKPA